MTAFRHHDAPASTRPQIFSGSILAFLLLTAMKRE
jgi:hypothetical protein